MKLTDYCQSLITAVTDAGQWVARNGEVVRNEQSGLLKDLRKAGRNLRRCARAAERKMCAGVFGPSQAGKSYLISALARDAQGNLLARFGDELHDFISEINPVGGKESTGLVTRFTMTRPTQLPQGFPVQVRLLSETDLVKIIANTYFADCEHKDDPQSDINATLLKLEKRARQPQGDAHIDLDAMEDLREYLRDFRSKARVQELERTYWERAIVLGPKLALDDRVALYALIWDEVDALTVLLRQLLQALAALGHADEAFCPLAALIPREGSIIDVATLAALDNGAEDESLDMVTRDGHKAHLPRAAITALTAELTIVMENSPDDYFGHTDLLDFPGYRSREKYTNIRQELQREGVRKNMFLRGKVAYLFQRYCAERELTSMLLCIGPSNQEVKDLPGVIDDWISSTHGKLPEERAGKQVSLFFILTKFDMEFEIKSGDNDPKMRWDNRLHASLLDFFGQQHDWPREWDGSTAFNNLFLLRNPNYRFKGVLKYEKQPDGTEREVGIEPSMQDYVHTLEEAFMSSKLVHEHFRDPRVAWDAAMRFNDGGILYIRDSLRPLCNPDIKRVQIEQALEHIRKHLLDRLKVFYKTDDKEEERKKKMQFYQRIASLLGRMESQQHRMGLLLHHFTVQDVDIFEMHDDVERRFRALSDAGPQDAAPLPAMADEPDEADLGQMLDAMFGNAGADAAPAGQDAPAATAQSYDEAAFFAENVENYWVSRLHTLADDADMQKYFALPAQEFSTLISELTTGAARLGLCASMAAGFREAARYTTNRESIIWQQAGIAAHILNSYVDWLGRDPRTTSDAERTISMGSVTTTAFTPPPPVTGFPELAADRSNYTMAWYKDWFMALYALLMDNVHFDGQQNINVEENNKLGVLLKHFASSPAGVQA